MKANLEVEMISAKSVMRHALLDGPGNVVLNVLEALEDAHADCLFPGSVSVGDLEKIKSLKDKFDHAFKVFVGGNGFDKHTLIALMDENREEVNNLSIEVDQLSWVKDLFDAFYSEMRL